MNVADAFPARQQPDGTVWFRGIEHDGKLGDGWTSNPAYAHPDYDVKMGDDGSVVTWRGDPWAPATAAETPVKWHGVDPDDPSITYVGGPAVGLPDELPEITINGKRLDWPTVMKEPLQPEVAVPALSLTNDFEIAPPPARFTKWCRYPLPPLPPRAEVKHGQWGWYRLPSPTTGRPTGFPRATTIAKTIDDERGLEKWKRRETARRVFELAAMPHDQVINEFHETTAADALEALGTALEGSAGDVDNALDVIDDLMGGAEARELGECAHAWIEALALGTVLLRDVPDVVAPHVEFARGVMRRMGLVAVPAYVERVVLNDRGDETVAGRIDCIWRIVSTGDYVLGDVKTSKSLKYGWLPFGVQVGGVYGWSTRILSVDGKSWDRMPKLVGVPHPDDHAADCSIRETNELWTADEPYTCVECGAAPDDRPPYAILLHVPSDQPEHAAAVTIDMTWGAEVYMESLSARSRQKEAPREVPKHVIPAPSDAALRYVEARLALTEISSDADGQRIYDEYQDVWDDDLTDFAAQVAELL